MGQALFPRLQILPDGVGERVTILNKVKELERNDTCIHSSLVQPDCKLQRQKPNKIHLCNPSTWDTAGLQKQLLK